MYSLDSTDDGKTFLCLGLPIIFGKFICGTSSPAIPALILPEPYFVYFDRKRKIRCQ
jgi:hypothetical protein